MGISWLTGCGGQKSLSWLHDFGHERELSSEMEKVLGGAGDRCENNTRLCV